MNALTTLRTLMSLGPLNVLRVAVYRLSLKAGIHPAQRLRRVAPDGPFYGNPHKGAPKGAVARDDWTNGQAVYFGLPLKLGAEPPDWFANPFRDGVKAEAKKPWWEISDFDPGLGDIKTVWEASRFDWLIAMTERAALGHDDDLARLNLWLQDWVQNNPPYCGVNWKCGQEASIRVMHLALSAHILGQVEKPESSLLALVKLHLERIAPTMSYAIGQANNHGTSEAAALYIGGSWLAAQGDEQGRRWQSIGQGWLEERASTLIEGDGTFSQYSVNYHRMMLDTYSFAQCWRQSLALPELSRQCRERLAAATNWLAQMVDPETGWAPNIGANDGALVLRLTKSDARDFRPSVQLASALFRKTVAYDKPGVWDQPLTWLKIERPQTKSIPLESITHDQGGLHILRSEQAVAYLRYPRFRFRPSQADALHCDLWVNGQNIARDAGTFSYNSGQEDLNYFSGTRAHNTVMFDGRDQMPRLGRFLFGGWLKARRVEPVRQEGVEVTATASYTDNKGAEHQRDVCLGPRRMVCIDRISGFSERAILRWRLQPGKWQLKEDVLRSDDMELRISCDVKPYKVRLTQGEESLYYLQKTKIPVLEIEVDKAAVLTSEFRY